MKPAGRSILVVTFALLFGVVVAAVQVRIAAGTPESRESSGSSAPTEYPVVISRPAGPPGVLLDTLGKDGAPLTASCTTCHATREPDLSIVAASDLDEFHDGLVFEHGVLTCLACHNADDYDQLRLADGSGLPFPDVIDLCAQCHATQARDYAHGAHGGMMGYWDLTRGPRQRLNCIDCHDPHAPAYPRMMPTFKPRDRFLEAPAADDGARHE